MTDIHKVWDTLTSGQPMYDNPIPSISLEVIDILSNEDTTEDESPDIRSFNRLRSALSNLIIYFDDVTNEIESEDHIFCPDDIDIIDAKVEEIQDLTNDFKEYLNNILEQHAD